MPFEDLILEPDTRAAQPAANSVPIGTLYCVTDEGDIVERSDGAAWVAFSPAVGGGGTVTNTGTLTSGAMIVGNGGLDVTAVLATWPPQGRLTLTTGVPWMVTTATAQTTVYYTPAVGGIVPIYNGTTFVPTAFTELSQATTDNTKSPAAVANDSNYDVFVWNDGGTIRATRGPAWSTDTVRGTGAGTTELVAVNGLLLNAVAITNGPGASRGTYVGTVRSNGSAQIDMIFGGAGAAGGEDTILGVWNMYNRRLVTLVNYDNTDSWNYTTLTWRIKNGDDSNRIRFVIGWQGDGIYAIANQHVQNSSASVAALIAVALNSVTAPTIPGSPAIGRIATNNNAFSMMAFYSNAAPLGFNYVAPLEESAATGTQTWHGDNGGLVNVSIFTMATMG